MRVWEMVHAARLKVKTWPGCGHQQHPQHLVSPTVHLALADRHRDLQLCDCSRRSFIEDRVQSGRGLVERLHANADDNVVKVFPRERGERLARMLCVVVARVYAEDADFMQLGDALWRAAAFGAGEHIRICTSDAANAIGSPRGDFIVACMSAQRVRKCSTHGRLRKCPPPPQPIPAMR